MHGCVDMGCMTRAWQGLACQAACLDMQAGSFDACCLVTHWHGYRFLFWQAFSDTCTLAWFVRLDLTLKPYLVPCMRCNGILVCNMVLHAWLVRFLWCRVPCKHGLARLTLHFTRVEPPTCLTVSTFDASTSKSDDSYTDGA